MINKKKLYIYNFKKRKKKDSIKDSELEYR